MPRRALAAIAASVTLAVVVGLLGPSVALPPRPTGIWPPYFFAAHPSPYLVVALQAAAFVLGAYGAFEGWRALRRGWRPPIRRLLAASALATLALVLVPSFGSADPQSYAAYGHTAAIGLDPYATPPSDLNDAYGAAVESPWRDTTSVYGPLATWEQEAAARIAGDGPNAPSHAVFLLSLVGGIAFVLTGFLLQRGAHDDTARARAALLWSLNPLLLIELVGGAHIDVIVATGCVAGVLAIRRIGWVAAVVAGVFVSAACAVKATAALVGAGLALAEGGHRRISRLVALAVGAAVVLIPSYVAVSSHAFTQLGNASGFVSFASPWRLITHPLELAMGDDAARALIRALAWVATVVFAAIFVRGLPGHGDEARHHARWVVALTFAWLLTTPYVLPWYDGLVWALLLMLASSRFDLVLLAHTTVLSLAYLPGRDVALPGALHDVVNAWKSGVSPVVLLGLACLAVWLAQKLSTGRQSGTGRSGHLLLP